MESQNFSTESLSIEDFLQIKVEPKLNASITKQTDTTSDVTELSQNVDKFGEHLAGN